MCRNGGEFCGGQVPYCTAATDMMIMMMIGIRLFGIVTRLWARRYGVEIPVGTHDFSLLQNFHTDSGVHPAPFSGGTGVPSRV
jgi:hypothetical protein